MVECCFLNAVVIMPNFQIHWFWGPAVAEKSPYFVKLIAPVQSGSRILRYRQSVTAMPPEKRKNLYASLFHKPPPILLVSLLSYTILLFTNKNVRISPERACPFYSRPLQQ